MRHRSWDLLLFSGDAMPKVLHLEDPLARLTPSLMRSLSVSSSLLLFGCGRIGFALLSDNRSAPDALSSRDAGVSSPTPPGSSSPSDVPPLPSTPTDPSSATDAGAGGNAAGGDGTVSDGGPGPEIPTADPPFEGPPYLPPLVGDVYRVTITADESDPGATPNAPGGAGLSLREAIAFATTQGTPSVIEFDVAEVTLDGSISVDSNTPTLVLHGQGASLDGNELAPTVPCIRTSGNNITIDSMQFKNCRGRPIFAEGGMNLRVTNNSFRDGDTLHITRDVSGLLFANNQVSGSGGNCVLIQTPALILDNTIFGCGGPALQFNSVGTSQSVMWGNLVHSAANGILLGNDTHNLLVEHNTITHIGGPGLQVAQNNTGIDVRNNAFTYSGVGLAANDAQLTDSAKNLFWFNAPDCNRCTIQPTWLQEDPGYMDVDGKDFRPSPSSPLLDSAAMTGTDRNGNSPGLFNGAGPDIGYFER